MKEITKHYSNGELTIVWKPTLCIHAAECVKALPNVYNPTKKPWITAENANTEELINQITKCPSGALSYILGKETTQEIQKMETKIEVKPKGPLMVHGAVSVTKADGSIEMRDKTTSFCRCGASNNKPFCDGTHRSISFEE